VRREILLGILYSDLIGFHTYDYARHFLSSCTRVLGLPTMPNGVEVRCCPMLSVSVGSTMFYSLRDVLPMLALSPLVLIRVPSLR
jgi:hypothetical protein